MFRYVTTRSTLSALRLVWQGSGPFGKLTADPETRDGPGHRLCGVADIAEGDTGPIGVMIPQSHSSTMSAASAYALPRRAVKASGVRVLS